MLASFDLVLITELFSHPSTTTFIEYRLRGRNERNATFARTRDDFRARSAFGSSFTIPRIRSHVALLNQDAAAHNRSTWDAPRASVPHELVAELRERNALDIELYEWAHERLITQMHLFEEEALLSYNR